MLFQPTNISPSTFGSLGNAVVDATQPLTVSWQVNGNSALASFSIAFYKNDTTSTKLYDTGTLTDGCPFYGMDYSGNIVMFSYTIPSETLASSGITNGGSYKFVITQNGTEAGTAFSVVQSSASVFETKATPTLSIDSIPSPLPYRSYTFSATYSQAQGDSLTWFHWIITGSSGTILDTGNIYGSRDIRVKYDGLFSGTYTIKCTAETTSGVQVTASQEFTVSYAVSSMTGYLKATAKCDRVLLNWQRIQYMPGTASGAYTITDKTLSLPSGENITWNKTNSESMSIPWDGTLVWCGTMETGTPFTVQDADGKNVSLVLTDTEAKLTYGTETLYTHEYKPSSVVNQWVVIITRQSIYISLRQPYAGLYPSETLYPSATLYPKAFALNEYTFGGELTGFEPNALSLVSVNGEQECDYIWITGDILTEAQIASLTDGTDTNPTWTQNTHFLANFFDGLNAGNLYADGETVTGASIYRQEAGETTLDLVAEFPLSDVEAVDCATRNGQEYTYFLFPQSENVFLASPLTSDPVIPCGWDWVLLDCILESGNVYRAQAEYRFGKNLVSGSIGNNNEPNIMENFTQYPTVQIKSANYMSGTLQSLIGVINECKYSDTVSLKDALYKLSTSNHPMFLKSRKGDIWSVKIGGAISMETMDESAEQAQTISLPWVQVGTADGISIVASSIDGMTQA